MGQPGHINRRFEFELAGDAQQAADVIGVFVGNQNGVERLGLFADESEAPFEFLEAQSGIDEDSRPVRGNERRVPRTAAGQYAEL
jgi:hypothetical protein